MKKSMKVGTANARMSAIIKEFGFGSEVYQMASEYLEERVDEKFLKRNDVGQITGIRQLKEKSHLDPATGEKVVDQAGTPSDNVFGRSSVFDQMLPTVQGILKQAKEENKVEGTIKENKKMLVPLANALAETMRSYDTTVDDIYDVRDDVDALGDAKFVDEAQSLLDEREKTMDWIAKAKDLVRRYEEAAQKARQERN